MELLKLPAFWILLALLAVIFWCIYKLTLKKVQPARKQPKRPQPEVSWRTVEDGVLIDEWLDDTGEHGDDL